MTRITWWARDRRKPPHRHGDALSSIAAPFVLICPHSPRRRRCPFHCFGMVDVNAPLAVFPDSELPCNETILPPAATCNPVVLLEMRVLLSVTVEVAPDEKMPPPFSEIVELVRVSLLT